MFRRWQVLPIASLLVLAACRTPNRRVPHPDPPPPNEPRVAHLSNPDVPEQTSSSADSQSDDEEKR